MSANTAFHLLDTSKSISLPFRAQQMYVFNPTRGFIFFALGDNTIPNSRTARLVIPPFAERIFPVDASEFAVNVQLPNPEYPAHAKFFAQLQAGTIGGLSFTSPVDAPILLDTFNAQQFLSRNYSIPMLARWLRLHWTLKGRATNVGNLIFILTDGQYRYRMRLLGQATDFYSNFSDFAFTTGNTIALQLRTDFSNDVWDLTLRYEYIDRAEFPFPAARRVATRGIFVQFGGLAQGQTDSITLEGGFHSYALGARVRGNGTLCKNWVLTMRDNQSNQIYFELQPNTFAHGKAPQHPNYAILLPGDVQNAPAGGSAGQTIPVGGVTAYVTGGPNFDYQLSRALDVQVFSEFTLSFTPLDAATLFANIFLEHTEPL